MVLCRTSASARLLLLSTLSTYASVVGELSTLGGYTVGGKAMTPAGGKWTTGTSTKQMKFSYTTIGVVLTGNLNGVRYCVLRNSTGAGAGRLLCRVTLSTAAFSVVSPNTLTISPAGTGVFTMA